MSIYSRMHAIRGRLAADLKQEFQRLHLPTPKTRSIFIQTKDSEWLRMNYLQRIPPHQKLSAPASPVRCMRVPSMQCCIIPLDLQSRRTSFPPHARRTRSHKSADNRSKVFCKMRARQTTIKSCQRHREATNSTTMRRPRSLVLNAHVFSLGASSLASERLAMQLSNVKSHTGPNNAAASEGRRIRRTDHWIAMEIGCTGSGNVYRHDGYVSSQSAEKHSWMFAGHCPVPASANSGVSVLSALKVSRPITCCQIPAEQQWYTVGCLAAADFSTGVREHISCWGLTCMLQYIPYLLLKTD